MAHVRNAIMIDSIFMAPKMRSVDKEEVYASNAQKPLAALLSAFDVKGSRNYSVIGTEEEYIVGMFGSVPTDLEGWGCAWLLASEELFKYKREFIKQSPQWIAEMGKGYTHLFNYVDVRNQKSIIWLKHLGFKKQETINEYGHLKMPFILMVKEM